MMADSRAGSRAVQTGAQKVDRTADRWDEQQELERAPRRAGQMVMHWAVKKVS
jgi:hypothetical protein